MNAFLIATLATAAIMLPIFGAVALSCRRPWTAGVIITMGVFTHAVAWVKITEANSAIGGLFAIWEFLSLAALAMGATIVDSAEN